MEGLDAAIVVGGPAAVLIAADFSFDPIHRSRQFTVYSQPWGEEKRGTWKRHAKGITQSARRAQRATERKKALGMGHAGDGVC